LLVAVEDITRRMAPEPPLVARFVLRETIDHLLHAVTLHIGYSGAGSPQAYTG